MLPNNDDKSDAQLQHQRCKIRPARLKADGYLQLYLASPRISAASRARVRSQFN